jgi:hypothetical protein
MQRRISQTSMSPFGSGLEASEVFDRRGPAARRLQRQESIPVNRLVRTTKVFVVHHLHNLDGYWPFSHIIILYILYSAVRINW